MNTKNERAEMNISLLMMLHGEQEKRRRSGEEKSRREPEKRTDEL